MKKKKKIAQQLLSLHCKKVSFYNATRDCVTHNVEFTLRRRQRPSVNLTGRTVNSVDLSDKILSLVDFAIHIYSRECVYEHTVMARLHICNYHRHDLHNARATVK